MHRTFLSGGLLAATLALAACGGTTDTPTGAGDGPTAGACLEATPDCDDTGILDGAGDEQRCLPETSACDDTPGQDEPDLFDRQAATTQAEALLGLDETELDPDVRIGRRGEEHLILTEDDVLGRMTVELDINDMDEWVVTAVTVKLPDAPQTFTRHLT